jgi:hypothetical protein
MVQHSFAPIITHHVRITAREYVDVDRLGNQVHPMIHMLFPTTMQPSKTKMAQLELFSHGLTSTKMNFSIFPGQHNHQI